MKGALYCHKCRTYWYDFPEPQFTISKDLREAFRQHKEEEHS